MQEGQVVCYESRKLKDHKQYYVTDDLELATIIHALKMWTHYLLGMRFVLMSDNSRLRCISGKLNLNYKKERWLVTLSEFEFNIIYIKGKENVVADALSKKPQTFSLVALRVNLRERVLEKLFEYRQYLKVISALQNGKQIEPKFEGYVLKPDGLLRFQRRMY